MEAPGHYATTAESDISYALDGEHGFAENTASANFHALLAVAAAIDAVATAIDRLAEVAEAVAARSPYQPPPGLR